ncbi:MAG: radical SAM protein [Bdellovibrionales bacterium]|nr:radical SAM protein [Bdellovibrionales bacterium]
MANTAVPLEYINLKSLQWPMGVTYGPVLSRRLGNSLGINLLGNNKICSFDCPYCELGPSQIRMKQLKQMEFFPTVSEVEQSLRKRMMECLNHQMAVDVITISGNGEPTLHPLFLDCVKTILEVRNQLMPDKKVVILSNGVHLNHREIYQAMNLLDERMIKVDAGNEKVLKAVNQPLVRANLTKLTAGCRKLKDVIIQSLFVHGAVDNTQLSDVEEWLEIIGIINPKEVHLVTLDRIPSQPYLKKVDEDTLYTISSRLKRKLQIQGTVFT